jgi:Ca2+-binding RTX toxin-like protein
MSQGAIKKAGAVALAALGALLIASPAALASTVTVTGGDTLSVAETGDEVNHITVQVDPETNAYYSVKDTAATLTPSGTCVAVDGHFAVCPGTGIKTIIVQTGDRADAITLDPATIPDTISETVDGGSGNDYITGANTPGTLSGGSGNDDVHGRGTLNGGAGSDLLMGSPLADNLRGGRGGDRLDGGVGADDIAGGSQVDTLVYSGRVNGVNVTIGSGDFNDGGPEDQTGSRRDTVHGDVEVQYGTERNDVLVGDRTPETLVGLGGDDLEVGNGGGDSVLGGPGGDRQFGKSGNDHLAGGPDDDFLRGGTGLDVMQGKNGIDRINARDGARDVKISCGPGPKRLEGAKRDRRLDPRPRSC